MSKVNSPCKPESGTQNQIFMNHKRVHYINSNQESNEITDRQIVNEDGASTQTENQIHQDQGETASSEVQSKQIDISIAKLNQHESVEGLYD